MSVPVSGGLRRRTILVLSRVDFVIHSCYHENVGPPRCFQHQDGPNASQGSDPWPTLTACLARLCPIHPPSTPRLWKLAKQLLNMRAHHIVGGPDRHDAEELVACLRRLAAIIDPVVAAIGSYANHHFGWVDQRLVHEPAAECPRRRRHVRHRASGRQLHSRSARLALI